MDTRQLPAPDDLAPERAALALDSEVEILELTALERPRRVRPGRVAFVVLIALLAGLVAMAGMPSRSDMAFDTPLPNFLAPNPQP